MPVINLANKRILIVEDDDMSFIYLQQLFHISKGTIIRAKNGIEAITIFKNNSTFDLVLMDIQLPDMDGTWVTREFRNINARVPIIAQTAGRTSLERDMAIEAGCSEVITKPYSMEELFKVISRYVKE
jgi:two-component system cell cycle response regulator DivK